MKYLLDTTVLADFANGVPAARPLVESLFSELHDLYTCDVVTAEALSWRDPDELRYVGALLDVLEYTATSPGAARWAGQSRRERGARGGRSLGDALIAGIAWSLGATIVTRNPDDFVRQGVPVLAY
ncbi:MAG: PIN domain-containing protein [Chloroflexi bacterium]|nr:PIN domain-containing protein [Chloroflexota bacterium]